MKRVLVTFVILLILSGCSHDSAFSKKENNIIVSDSNIEYTLLANEGILYYLGDLEFIGSIRGEKKTSQHLGLSYQTGMFAIKDTNNENILIRRAPNNEWSAIYRKTSLPNFDFSVDNCIRLEFVSGIGNIKEDVIHTICGQGITDQSEISSFLYEVRMQKSPKEAGLYELIEKTNGMLENCYTYGVVYGFFAEEPNLAVRMDITSYNDLAYSISIESKEYVLPIEWLEKFENK